MPRERLNWQRRRTSNGLRDKIQTEASLQQEKKKKKRAKESETRPGTIYKIGIELLPAYKVMRGRSILHNPPIDSQLFCYPNTVSYYTADLCPAEKRHLHAEITWYQRTIRDSRKHRGNPLMTNRHCYSDIGCLTGKEEQSARKPLTRWGQEGTYIIWGVESWTPYSCSFTSILSCSSCLNFQYCNMQILHF